MSEKCLIYCKVTRTVSLFYQNKSRNSKICFLDFLEVKLNLNIFYFSSKKLRKKTSVITFNYFIHNRIIGITDICCCFSLSNIIII